MGTFRYLQYFTLKKFSLIETFITVWYIGDMIVKPITQSSIQYAGKYLYP